MKTTAINRTPKMIAHCSGANMSQALIHSSRTYTCRFCIRGLPTVSHELLLCEPAQAQLRTVLSWQLEAHEPDNGRDCSRNAQTQPVCSPCIRQRTNAATSYANALVY